MCGCLTGKYGRFSLSKGISLECDELICMCKSWKLLDTVVKTKKKMGKSQFGINNVPVPFSLE